jgi:hypothetical protein
MAGESLLNKLKAMGEAGSVPRPREDPPPQPEDDSYEEPAGDGRSARHQVFSVQLVQANRNAQAVTYQSMHSPLTFDPSRGISFRFENAEGLFEVRIEGRNLDRVYDKLCVGKREVIRQNGETVTAISVRVVPQAKE